MYRNDFSSKEVEQDKLDKILEAGRIAPTARNLQPIKIYVVRSEEYLNKIDKSTVCRYNAPVVLLVCGDTKRAYSKGRETTYEIDASIVTTHMMLEATNIGVNSVWVKAFDSEVISEEFNLPNNIKPVCLLPIGYKAKLCPPSPFHKIRKNIKELVEYR